MRQAYWTVKDGEIVTAHINRHGKEVNYRRPFSKSADIKIHGSKRFITFKALNGVLVDDLVLEAVQDCTVLKEDPLSGMSLVLHELVSKFQDIIIRVTDYRCWMPTPGRRAEVIRKSLEEDEKYEEKLDKVFFEQSCLRKEKIEADVEKHLKNKSHKDILAMLGISDFRRLAAATTKHSVKDILCKIRDESEIKEHRRFQTIQHVVANILLFDFCSDILALASAAREILKEENLAKKNEWLAKKSTRVS